jgi:hypothetical protein
MDTQPKTFGRRVWRHLSTPHPLGEAAFVAAGLGTMWYGAAEKWAPRMGTGTFLLWNLAFGLFFGLFLFAIAAGSSRR